MYGLFHEVVMFDAAVRASRTQVMVVGFPRTVASFDVGAASYYPTDFKRRCDEGA